MTRKFAALAVLLALFSSALPSAETRIVKVGAFDDRPLIFLDEDGFFKGIYVDLLTEIGLHEDIRFEYVFGSWQDGLDRIKAGEVDMLTDVAYSQERAEYIDYCSVPLMTFWGELYVPKSSAIYGLLDLSGKKIGALKGDIFNINFRDLIEKFSIDSVILELNSYEDIFRAIAAGQVDAGVAPGLFKFDEQQKYGVKSTGFVYSPLDVFFVTKTGENGDLRNILDAYLKKWRGQSVSPLSEAKQQWIYGGLSASHMPVWLVNLLIALSFAIFLAGVFIFLLRIQVKNATAKILQRETALRESEKNFRTMVDTVPLAISLTTGIEQRTEYLNSTMRNLFGYSIDDIRTADQWWLLAYRDEEYRREISEKWNDRIRTAIETQTPIEPMEVVVDCKDGSRKNILWGFIPMGGKNYSCGLDLTAVKAAEARTLSLLSEKELLLKEVHHRIKNNMTSIKGLLSLQLAAEKDETVIASLKDAESRVQSIIMLYDRLYCTDNYRELPAKEYLEPLVAGVIGSFRTRVEVTLNVEVDDCILNVRLLSPLGIIVNELMTNIMKYAFEGREKGIITIRMSVADTIVTLIIEDDGIGMSENESFEHSTGFGLQLVGMLCEQLGGKLKIERKAGTVIILEFKK